ncbi:ATP-binding protein [Actinomycetes bacterium M1A6_2h]
MDEQLAGMTRLFGTRRVRVPGWARSRWTIRLRSAVVAAGVVALSLVIGGSALVWFVVTSTTATVDTAAENRLHDITTALGTTPPDRIDPFLLATDQNVVLVQIVDASGTVVRASTGAPDVALIRYRDDDAPRGDGRRPDRQPRAVSISADVPTSAGTFTVVVGASNGDQNGLISKVVALLAVLAPIITVIAGVMTYWLVGRSLRSMERMRIRVSEITSADLGERIPVSENKDEISSLADTLNGMLERIETGQIAQRRFVSDASHELRSPLATIAGALELGREAPETLDADLLDHTLLPEMDRVRTLVEDLLVLARADENGVPLSRNDVDLDDVAQHEVDMLRSRTTHDVNAHLTPTRVHGDVGALTRVLRNLTDNADRHANSRIDVVVRHDETAAYAEVSDDGPGIAEEDRVRVFDRFVRLDEHRSRAKGGAGLGLAIANEIVVAHGGDVTVHDRDGGGTLVSVRLPFVADT